MCENICSLNSLDDTSILSNLKERFQKKKIYTYSSEVLIAINPYENVSQLYGLQQINRYRENLIEKPPHVYAIASEALKNLRLYKKQQSILITGVSGSGKTENGKHIVEFLCQTKSDSQNVIDIGPIFEAFGNAKTRGNANSSRFCKFMQLMYDADMKQSGAKVNYHMLETNRICAANKYESNFHIFYALLLGSTNDILENLLLDPLTLYKYLPDKDLVLKSTDNSIWRKHFFLVDNKLNTLEFTMSNKNAIYRVLSAILNLGNIQFDTKTNHDGCFIKKDLRKFLCSAAVLLNVDEFELEDALTNHTRVICNQQIKSPLARGAAEKTRDILAKGLYDKLFGQIMKHINDHLSSSSFDNSIGILDIAGFEYLTHGKNTFDQLCINYSNERLQSFFVDLKLLEEKQWYSKQRLDIPFVQFLDNSHIIDLFHNETKGVFTLLNDECRFRTPSTENFTDSLKNSWQKDTAAPISWNVQGQKSNGNIFSIQHFTNEVIYSTDDFVEKNQNNIPQVLRLMIENSTGLYETSNIKSDKSSASALKCEIDSLIEELKKTNIHFIRCILPNNEKQNEMFEEELVLNQLKTSSIVSHAKFIRFGYSKRIDFKKLVEACKPIEKKIVKLCADQLDFYLKVLLSLGLKLNEFKMGNDVIFFRSNKFHLVVKFLSDALEAPKLSSLGTTIPATDQLVPQRRKPKSLSIDPLERIEGFVWNSKWKCILSAIKFLIRYRNDTIKKKSCPSKVEDTLQLIQMSPIKINHQIQEPVHESAHEPKHELGKSAQKRSKTENPFNNQQCPAEKRRKVEKRPLNKDRYDLLGHWPEIDKSHPVRCKNEDCNLKTYVLCIKCKVHLCFLEDRNCFKNFHLLREDGHKNTHE